ESFWKIKATSGVKVEKDLTPPEIGVEFAFPNDGNYYTHNSVTLTVTDNESEVASVRLNGNELKNVDGTYFAEIIKSGKYIVYAQDVAGNISTYEFYAYIDNVSPMLDVRVFDDNGEFVHGNAFSKQVSFDATATFGESGGRIEYRIDGKEWIEYNDILNINKNVIIEFRAVSNSSDGRAFLTSEILEYRLVGLAKPTVEVTADWFIVDGVKKYDGTDKINDIKLNEKSSSLQANFEYRDYIDFAARYATTDAGDNVEIIIDVWTKDNVDFVLVNHAFGVYGVINRKDVMLTLDYAEKTYGDLASEYYYTVDGVLDGDEIEVEFVSNANVNSVPDENEYRFWLEKSEFGNYSIANFDELNSYEKGGEMIIHKALITQLANDEKDFIDLDTESVADLKIKFKDLIDSEVYHILDIYFSVEEICMSIDKIEVAGTYTLRLTMPENLQSRYELDKSLSEIQIFVGEVEKVSYGDDSSNSSESPKEHGSEIGSMNTYGNDEFGIVDNDVKNTYGAVAVAVGVAATSLIAVAILKRLISKRRLKKKS
ncbi:MAG: hypothetical protein K2K24_01415, partial [Clostridia bacterium]|nr:hypothetical protein [Clostridia bacterium]